MSPEKILVIGSGVEVIDSTMLESRLLDIQRIDITLKPEPFIPNLDIRIERQERRRDWEQRERKRPRR